MREKKSDKATDDAHKILYPDLPMILGSQAFCPLVLGLMNLVPYRLESKYQHT